MSQELYIFGSVTRGEINPTSDLDVLVVTANGQTRELYPATWSCYKESSLRRLHDEGRLFAWHLFLDSICVYSVRQIPFIRELGPPNAYSSARKDIVDLTRLLTGSLDELFQGTPNTIYELGIVYTCLRDIAMAASWHLLKRPTFSQMAPYLLPLAFPVEVGDYNAIMLARHASTRGVEGPRETEGLRERLLAAPLGGWLAKIKEEIR